MYSGFSPTKLVCTVVGACALLAAAPLADAARSNTMTEYSVHTDDANASKATVLLAEDIIIEREPEIRIIQPEPELRVRIETPGYYEEQRVLVKPGHFEEYKVWVPERYDPELDATFHGHYKTQKRWVPSVYETRKVWVPSGTD